ncbi:MAG: glycerophosphodiester phosphodiesterase [Agitococcus sp.]
MLIIGHRGARGEAPENTLSGFNYLKSLGVFALELDIHVSKDQQLVVIHDYSLERTTTGVGLVKEQHSADLAALNACFYFKDWPYHDGVPLLKDVLALVNDFVHLQLEVKVKDAEDYAIVGRELNKLWPQFTHRMITTSFNTDYLDYMQRHYPHISRGLLVESNFTGNIIVTAQQLDCQLIAPHHSLLNKTLIDTAHHQGLIVSTWTVNDAQQMQDLAAMGLDSLITDYPSLALKTFIT